MGYPVEIRWCFHSYVVLRYGGKTLAIDPHDGGSLGLPTCRLEADYILVTHDHFDHNAVEVASGPNTRILKAFLGETGLGPFKVTGIKVYHDKAKGALRGWVSSYIIEAGGYRIAHLGDVGHLLSRSEYPMLEGLDLLFIPVGGVYTINAAEAWAVIEELKPRIAVPIHYWLRGSHLPLDPLDRFLSIARTGRKPLEENRIVIRDRSELPEKTTIYYFKEGITPEE